MSQADALERQMLDLINQERTSRGLNPVQLELRLNESAEDHSEWMLAQDVFSHTGIGGSSAGDRMRDAGFDFSGSWSWAENIAWQSERGSPGLEDDVVDLHNSLMNSPGHRANILAPDLEYIGIGIERGNFNGWDAVMVTQNFARTSGQVQLDNGGAGSGGGGTGGGGTTTVPAATDGADILALAAAGSLSGLGGNDELTGSSGNDTLKGNTGNDLIKGQGGNDTLEGGNNRDTLEGGDGNDKLFGGNGRDVARGGNGNDTLSLGNHGDRGYGGNGDDVLNGKGGHDKLWGGGGNDTLSGGNGNDRLTGGNGNDALTGGYGSDVFVFSAGNDVVRDFGGADRIDLGGAAGITSYSDLTANHARNSGTDVLIEDANGNSFRIEDTQLQDLNSGDFLF